jgi:hypothetical protein
MERKVAQDDPQVGRGALTLEQVIERYPEATRGVSWEQIEAYAQRCGWTRSPKASADSRVVMWERPGTFDVIYIGGTDDEETKRNARHAITTIAAVARAASEAPHG